jgi:TetR/AcrR family fatty acid metabolism transcriptional regulator
LIFGTLDLILIAWLIKNRPEKPTDIFEPFFDLFIHAIADGNLKARNCDKRKLILDAAATIFAQTGYQKARVQDIAKLAGVADGTIYQYFKNKQEILFTLPIEETKELIDIQEEHLNGIKNPDFKLDVLITDYLRFLDANKNYSSIVLFELRYNKNFYTTPAYELLRKFARTYYDVIKEGIETKHFRDSISPYIAMQMIFGVIDHSLLTCLLFKKPISMMDAQADIYSLIIQALKGGMNG